MKVRITDARAGTIPCGSREGEPFAFAAGEEVDIPQEWAKALLNGGGAEPVAEKRVSRAEKRPAARRGESR